MTEDRRSTEQHSTEPRTPEQTIREAEPANAEQTARAFHEAYERLAPQHGYETRKESAVPWEDVPANNKALMTAVCGEVVGPLVAELADLREQYESLDGWYRGKLDSLGAARAELAERTAALERTNDSYLAAEREIERLRAELAAARQAERTMHEMKERHAGDADYLLRQRNAAFAKGEEYRAKWEAGERCLADTREALKRVAVNVAIRKAERHKGEITGDDCPLCRRDQHELDLIGAALAAAPSSPAEAPPDAREHRWQSGRSAIFSSAVGMARLALDQGNPDHAKQVLDDAAEKSGELMASLLTEAPQAEPASEQIGYVDLGTLGSVPMYVREAASTAEPDTETRAKCPNPRCHEGWVGWGGNESGGAPAFPCRTDGCPRRADSSSGATT